jgi:hypothetical protein
MHGSAWDATSRLQRAVNGRPWEAAHIGHDAAKSISAASNGSTATPGNGRPVRSDAVFEAVEATTGFEPVNRGFADLRVEPLHHVAKRFRREDSTGYPCFPGRPAPDADPAMFQAVVKSRSARASSSLALRVAPHTW